MTIEALVVRLEPRDYRFKIPCECLFRDFQRDIVNTNSYCYQRRTSRDPWIECSRSTSLLVDPLTQRLVKLDAVSFALIRRRVANNVTAISCPTPIFFVAFGDRQAQ